MRALRVIGILMSAPFGPAQDSAAKLGSAQLSSAQHGIERATSTGFKSKQVKSKRPRSALARQSVRTVTAAVAQGMAAAFAFAAPAASAMPAAPGNAVRAVRDAAAAQRTVIRPAAGTHELAARLRAYRWATTQAGHPYVWGGTGPGYDCSGLVMMAYRHAGINLPRTTYGMLASRLLVRIWHPRQGDLAFYGSGHV